MLMKMQLTIHSHDANLKCDDEGIWQRRNVDHETVQEFL
jgi:hypothetical protein